MTTHLVTHKASLYCARSDIRGHNLRQNIQIITTFSKGCRQDLLGGLSGSVLIRYNTMLGPPALLSKVCDSRDPKPRATPSRSLPNVYLTPITPPATRITAITPLPASITRAGAGHRARAAKRSIIAFDHSALASTGTLGRAIDFLRGCHRRPAQEIQQAQGVLWPKS